MNEKIVINGGLPLRGEVSVTGAKNAAVAILPATVLAGGEYTIENLPNIADVRLLKVILISMGAKVDFDTKNHVMRIDTTSVKDGAVTGRPVEKMRASYYFLGSMLGRFGHANIRLPGGCAIGERPIDQHEKGMKILGAKIDIKNEMIVADAPEGLRGRDVFLDKVSVGATINIMLAAVLAKGDTSIINAAKEPHVVDVANFLTCMGAKIKGAGTDTIRIRGVERLHSCSYSIIPDQIETGTLMIAAAATKGDVTITNAIPTHMEALSAKLVEMGVCVDEKFDTLRVHTEERPRAVHIKTSPYPGFPTDLQQPATVLLSVASGTSVIEESVFEQRFKHINEIRRMGAKVSSSERVAVVEGVDHLSGAAVRATDLRAGAALIVAGLMADGQTEIYNVKYVDRGYENIETKLRALGADIRREEIIETEDEEY